MPKPKNKAVKLGATKFDQGKPDMALISSVFMEELAKALTYGQRKYSRFNWKNGFIWSRPASASLRHIFAWLRGETIDPDSNCHHLACAAANLMFLIDFHFNQIGEDDRYKKEQNK